MKQAGFQAPNSLVLLQQAKKLPNKPKEPLTNRSTDHMSDADSVVTELHGAEEEVARGNAVIAQLEESRQKTQTTGEGQQYMPSSEVYAAICLLFEKEKEILNLVYNSRPTSKKTSAVTADMFFIRNILVPPNRFRPAAAQGPNEVVEAQQNAPLPRF
jgi:hypothetical protein